MLVLRGVSGIGAGDLACGELSACTHKDRNSAYHTTIEKELWLGVWPRAQVSKHFNRHITVPMVYYFHCRSHG